MRSKYKALVVASILLLTASDRARAQNAEDVSTRASGINAAYAAIKEFIGRDFVGGKKPAVANILFQKEFKDPTSGFYYYQHKVEVRRAGGDTDGFFTIYSAPTWGEAANQILKLHPNLREQWALRLFAYGYTTPFTPVRAQYSYLLGVRDPQGVYHASSGYLNRLRTGPKSFSEVLSVGLYPGNYTLELDSEVTLASHPLTSLWDVKEWFDFGKDIYQRDFWSALGISSSVLNWVLRNEYTRTTIKYHFAVMAKMPNVVDLDYVVAKNELQSRRVRVRINGIRRCSANKGHKVLKQSVRTNKAVRAKDLVTLDVCAKKPNANPVPTPVPGSKYYIYIATNGGNSIFIATPQEILNIPLCSVEGAGNNCSVKANFSAAIAGPFVSLAAAQAAVCAHLTGKHYNMLVPWGPWVRWGAIEYRCFEPECEAALANYCPNLSYY